MSSSSARRSRRDAATRPTGPEPIYAPAADPNLTGAAADFIPCPVAWDGPGGTYDLSGTGVSDHTCIAHLPEHAHHVCCCGAALDLADPTTRVTAR